VRTPTRSPLISAMGPRARALALALTATLPALGCGEKQAPPPPPPPEVTVASVVQRDVPVVLELVGQTRGSEDVEIRARVEGFLEEVSFEEGSMVRKGQVLYRIDPKPLQAKLATAQADLETWKSRHVKTENDVKRLTPLAKQQAVSQQELDNAVAAESAAKAQVQASISTAESARLDLGYTTVTSPIDGLVGTTLVKAGNLVGRGETTLLTTVSKVDPILFRAGISEAEYLRIARRTAEAKSSGSPPVPVDLVLADGTVHPQRGRLDVVERAVDAATGTLTIQFKYPNPGGILRPGQYGRARGVIDVRKNAMLVPQRAVQELQNLYNVAVVGSDNKLSMKTVTVGPRVASLWVIESGLTLSDRVVVEGLQRTRPGMTVSPKAAPPAPAGSGNAEPMAGGEGK